MAKIVEEKSFKALTMDQFVQEMVLGKIASDIYNEAKKIVPLRHVGVRKSKLLTQWLSCKCHCKKWSRVNPSEGFCRIHSLSQKLLGLVLPYPLER
jgi:ribosomal protein S3AE